MRRRQQRGVITLLMAAALASAATYVLVPRKFDGGEYAYYVSLDVQAKHLADFCPYREQDVAGLRNTTESLLTWTKYRDSTAEQNNATLSGKILADTVTIAPTTKAECDSAAANLEKSYARVLKTLGRGK